MKEASVVRRYAESLFVVSEKQNCTDEVYEQLKLIEAACGEGDLSKALAAPSILISDEQKKAVVKDLFGSRIHNICLNFLYLLIDRKRTGILESCAQEFETLVYESRNIELAEVESVCELSPEELDELKAGLEKHMSKKLIIRTATVNPALIGGIKVTVGNDVLDGSLAAALSDIKRSLMSF